MGLRLFGTSATRAVYDTPAVGDPDPSNFNILKLKQVGHYVIAEVQYPDALNYNGVKLSLYKATTSQLRNTKRLDPHFNSQEGPLVPIARFEPTARGWGLALICANALDDAHKLG